MGSSDTIVVSKVELALPPLIKLPLVTSSREMRPVMGARTRVKLRSSLAVCTVA
jgi:hypothetical protein